MSSEIIDVMVEGGKTTPTSSIAQRIGPLGINITEVMNKINEKTSSFKGMQVPVKLKIDKRAKEVTDIEVSTPPTTELIKKEVNIEKGSSQPDKEKVANISIEQCIKIAKMKKEAMYVNNLKTAVKTVIGSCNSLGILIEGKTAREIEREIDAGKYDTEINLEKIEMTEEKKKLLVIQLKERQVEIAKALEKLKATESEKEKPKEVTPPETEEKPKIKEEKKTEEKKPTKR